MALVAMFVALIVGSGWALAMVPNVELVTTLAFTAGAVLGPLTGAIVAASGMFLFSATNPVGSGLAFPVLLAAQVVSQAIIGLLGGLFYRVSTSRLNRLPQRLLITGLGLLGTLLYDGLTSISFPLYAGAPASEIVALLLSGLAFTVIHQGSNVLIFFLLVPRLVQIGRKSHPAHALRPDSDPDPLETTPQAPPFNGLERGKSSPGESQPQL